MRHKTMQYRRWQRHNHIIKRKNICNNHKTFAAIVDADGKQRTDSSREVKFEKISLN